MFLPYMHKKSESQKPDDGEVVKCCWVINGDMFVFENIGFSNTVGTTKYLICADCEIGPLGWHDTSNTQMFYFALDRVKLEGE